MSRIGEFRKVASEVDLSISRIRDILKYDPTTGHLFWKVNAAQNVKAGMRAGWLGVSKYREVRIDRRNFKEHRVAWALHHGKWPQGDIDHVNGVRDDNRIANLRDVTRSVNGQNKKRARSDSLTGVMGVALTPGGRFRAYAWIDRRQVNLGTFDTREQAAEAHLNARRRHYEGNTL